MYKQRIETSDGRIVTGGFRILAKLFMVPGIGVADYLNRSDRPFLPLGEPQLFAPGGELPSQGDLRAAAAFLALPKTEIWWIGGGRLGQGPGGLLEERPLALLYGDYLLRGRLRVGGHVRTSDFIAQRVSHGHPFDSLLDVSLCRLDPGTVMDELPPIEEFDHVTINLSQNMGVFDLSYADYADSALFTLEDETGKLS